MEYEGTIVNSDRTRRLQQKIKNLEDHIIELETNYNCEILRLNATIERLKASEVKVIKPKPAKPALKPKRKRGPNKPK